MRQAGAIVGVVVSVDDAKSLLARRGCDSDSEHHVQDREVARSPSQPAPAPDLGREAGRGRVPLRRVRAYDAKQAIFVVVCAELRRRGLSFQRSTDSPRSATTPHRSWRRRYHRPTPGFPSYRRRQSICGFSKPNLRTCFKLFPPVMCVNVSNCVQRIHNAVVA